jgi:WD40 repeat protein
MGEVFGGAAVVFDRTFPTELGGVKLCDQMYAQSGYLDVRGDVASVLGSCDVNNGTLADVYLIDPVTLEVSSVLADQGWMRTSLSADGSLLATQVGRSAETKDGEVYLVSDVVLRDTTNGRVSRVMEGLCEWDPTSPEPGAECAESPNTPFPDWPWELTFSPDDALLAMASLNDSLILWDTGTGEIVRTSTVDHDSSGPNVAMAAAFSPSGDQIAVSFGPAPKELWLISAKDGQSIAQYVAPDEADTIEPPSQNFLFTPDGEELIGTDLSSFGEGRIVFMDGRTLEHLDQISDAHANGVADLALNPDGSLLASAGVDGVVRIWEVATRSLVHEVPVSPVGEGVGGVDFVGDTGHLLVTALESGELRKVTTDTEELLGIARERITRGFTNTECNTYHIDPCPTLDEVREG